MTLESNHPPVIVTGISECRSIQIDWGKFSCLHRTDVFTNPVSNGGIDGVLRDVPLNPKVVMSGIVLGKTTPLHFHFVGRLPGSTDHFSDSAHRLRVRRDHRERAQIVQNVFGRNRLASNARFGKCNVFGNARIKMVADHEHIEVFIHRIGRIRTRRIR